MGFVFLVGSFGVRPDLNRRQWVFTDSTTMVAIQGNMYVSVKPPKGVIQGLHCSIYRRSRFLHALLNLWHSHDGRIKTEKYNTVWRKGDNAQSPLSSLPKRTYLNINHRIRSKPNSVKLLCKAISRNACREMLRDKPETLACSLETEVRRSRRMALEGYYDLARYPVSYWVYIQNPQ